MHLRNCGINVTDSLLVSEGSTDYTGYTDLRIAGMLSNNVMK
jgi:hypothetical protein